MSNCPKCNAELKPGAVFCHVCGYQIPKQQHQQIQTTNLNHNTMENQNVNTPTQSGGIVQRVINIITKPKEEWNIIANETPNVGNIFTLYVLPLLLIPTVSQIIGLGLIGKKIGVGLWSVKVKSWELGITTGISTFIGGLIAIYLVALVIDLLAPSFGSEKNFGRSFQLAAYSWTPAWIAGIFYIFPALGIIAILAGIYGLVLLYLGIAPLKKTPADKIAVYFIVSLVVVIVISIVVALVLGLITTAIYSPSVGNFNMNL